MNTHTKSKLFESWLKTNSGRFIHTPYLISRRRGILSYGLHGITPEITFSVYEGNISIWVYYHNHPFDMLRDIDINEQFEKGKGYYCGFCTITKYFDSPEEMYISHNFEELLDYVNTVLANASLIGLYHFDGGSTEARIIKNEKDFKGILKRYRNGSIAAIISVKDSVPEIIKGFEPPESL